MQRALKAGPSASRTAPALLLLAEHLGISLHATRVHAGSPGHGRSFPYQLALVALVVALCASMAHGQSPADSGRSVSAGGTATLANDSAGSFAGKVVQGDGMPLAGAVVSVFGASDSALTTGEGHFELHRLPFGAHMVSVRRLGFAPKRFALTIAPGVAPDVTITMGRFVPVLPTVTTTAEERAAYHSVGFDERMKVGQGQFLTYDQIVRKQATVFTDLLRQMRGIVVHPAPYGNPEDDRIVGTRGPGSCVAFVVDGVPQQVGETPNRVIATNEVGAVEVYSSSERPAGLGGMDVPDEPPTGGSQTGPTLPGGTAIGGGKSGGVVLLNQQCVLVVVWTRARLGLVGAQETPNARAAMGAVEKEPIRAVTTFALDSSCSPPPPRDTTDLLVYATVLGTRPEPMSDKAWADYEHGVLVAIDRWAELPSELFLPSFSLPVSTQAQRGSSNGGGSDVLVTPSLSSVLAFSLDSSGAVNGARVVASSLSDGADTSVLAMVEQATAARAFPHLPMGVNAAVLYLVVQSAEPTVGTQAAVLGALEVPEWRLSRPARLVRESPPDGLVADSTAPDRIPVMMVVDASGHVVGGTARLGTSASTPLHASLESQAEIVKRLPDLRFDPARIGACRVNEFVVQSFALPKPAQR